VSYSFSIDHFIPDNDHSSSSADAKFRAHELGQSIIAALQADGAAEPDKAQLLELRTLQRQAYILQVEKISLQNESELMVRRSHGSDSTCANRQFKLLCVWPRCGCRCAIMLKNSMRTWLDLKRISGPRVHPETRTKVPLALHWTCATTTPSLFACVAFTVHRARALPVFLFCAAQRRACKACAIPKPLAQVCPRGLAIPMPMVGVQTARRAINQDHRLVHRGPVGQMWMWSLMRSPSWSRMRVRGSSYGVLCWLTHE